MLKINENWLIRDQEGRDHYFSNWGPTSTLCGSKCALYATYNLLHSIHSKELWLYSPKTESPITLTKVPIRICRECKRVAIMEQLGE